MLGGVPVTFQEYLPYNGLRWMWQVQIVGEITGLCVLSYILKPVLTLTFSTEELKVFIKMSSLFIEF